MRRLADFQAVGRGPDPQLFAEMCFCFLAIQTNAHAADAALRALDEAGFLWRGDARALARVLHHRVRFHNHKASYIVRARERFFGRDGLTLRGHLDALPSDFAARTWLVQEVDGLGWKEASHFLRNIGRGDDLAILDRHILRNLARHQVIGRLPSALTARRYIRIEAEMRTFAGRVGIPLPALDLLFWSHETGEIFK